MNGVVLDADDLGGPSADGLIEEEDDGAADTEGRAAGGLDEGAGAGGLKKGGAGATDEGAGAGGLTAEGAGAGGLTAEGAGAEVGQLKVLEPMVYS